MYGTVIRMQVEPSQDGAIAALHEQWLRERKPHVEGFIADYALKSERVPGEWLVLVIFDTEEHYRANAADPEQHRQYESLRALLTADPEWNDGEILAIESAWVPV
jgi:heme-degrading monooxygenase HmoA